MANIAVLNAVFGGSSTSSSTSGLTTEAQFLHDAAAAKVISNDPNVKMDVNLQAGSESTAAIYPLATGVCTDLNNGANKADEANDLYRQALDESTTTGIHLSHDDAAKLVGLAIKDICPTAGK
ncbi:DUF732 domain-containing protein [Nocardia sp. NPDC046763]|uniref:DUF732 domain-containing protein n=1 Tax=Nocardia sp. NPDC046763 TaxID=3155256 RepID=UPI0033F70FEB